MPRLGNWIKETSTTTGTGDFTLAGAVSNFYTFNANFGTDTRFGYCIDNGAEKEIGIGYLSSSNVLVRETVRDSSNSGAAVNFSAGTKTVFCDISDGHIERASRGRNQQTVQGNFIP